MSIAFEYPIPKHWADFEQLLADLHPEMHPYGRPGQNQDGIDLVSNDGTRVIQAKKRGLGVENITIANLSSWISRANDFYKKRPFKTFILATTQQRDKYLQDELLNHIDGIKFEVEILFWDSIENLLRERPELTRKYYLTELYDPAIIESFKSGSLDDYIETTLLGSLVRQDTGHAWPSINTLVRELPYRLHSGFGQYLKVESLIDDYVPFSEWCDRILINGKTWEKSINKAFKQKGFLPIQWASSYIGILRKADIESVLETEMALLDWLNKMSSLLKLLKSTHDPLSLNGDSGFASKCDDVCLSLYTLTTCIADNAEALAAYKSLKQNMIKRGIPEYQELNLDKNIRFFGYYGFQFAGESYGKSISLFCKPLEQLGIRAWVILEGTPYKHYLRGEKNYIKLFPEFDNLRVFPLSSS